MSQFGTFCLLLILLSVFQNCGSSDGELRGSNQDPKFDDLNQKYKTLEELAASDLSCSQEADCVAVPVGERPCGGPSAYLVASLLNSQFDRIDELAAELADAERRFNLASEMAGTCDYRMPPSLLCSQSKCSTNLISGI